MSSDSDANGLSLAAGGGAARAARRLGPAASVRFSRSDSQPSRPWSELAGLTGGASVRRGAGPPRSGGGRFDALPRRPCAERGAIARRRRPHRLFLALHAGAAGGDHVEAAAVMRDDPVQFGQRLDLVDNHLAHLRGAFGGLLRHFQHAAAQFVAGGFEFVMHFRRHLLHARHHGGELVGGLLEHRVGFLGALLIDLAHGFGGQPALFLGRSAHRLELPADSGRTRTGGFATTRAISRARSSAAASDSSSRPVKRDSRCSRSPVRRSSVVTRVSSAVLRLATARWWCGCSARPGRGVGEGVAMRLNSLDNEARSSSAYGSWC